MNKIIALLGPELIGKSTVADRIAEYTSEKVIRTKDFSYAYPFYTCAPEESMEIFDQLKTQIDETGARIIEIETNIIEACSQKELDYLKKILTVEGNEPSFYLLLPSEDFGKSYRFLFGICNKTYGFVPGLMTHVTTSLVNPAYNMLEPKKLYTLDGYKKPLFNAQGAYIRNLDHSALLPIIVDISKEKEKPTR